MNNGNLMAFAASGTGTPTFSRSYTYDALNRLATMSSPADPSNCTGLSWTYDAWANRTAQNVTSGSCGAPQTPVYTDNRLTNSSYQYDAAGNLTNDGTHTYTYDAENRIRQVDSGNTATYVYDANGQRIQKTMGSSQVHYFYGEDGNVLVEKNQSGTVLKEYLYAGGQRMERSGGQTYFVHTDHLGSTRTVTNYAGAVADSLDYLPFGEQIYGDTATTNKFTGKERDGESGLDNFGARYDSSWLGRFMQPDSTGYSSLRQPQAWNLYSYTLNNPLKYTDPDGHKARCDKGTDEECLRAARESLASDAAASRLQLTKVQERAGWFSRVFLGRQTVTQRYLSIDGNVGSFRQLSANASKMADLVSDQRVFSYSISRTYSPTYTTLEGKLFQGGGTLVMGGSTSRVTPQGTLPAAWIDPNPGTYRADPDAASDGIPPANIGERMGHEFLGHIWAAEIAGLGPSTAEHKQAVLDSENAVRRTDPTRGQKTSHHD